MSPDNCSGPTFIFVFRFPPNYPRKREVSYKNKTERGAPNAWVSPSGSPRSRCQVQDSFTRQSLIKPVSPRCESFTTTGLTVVNTEGLQGRPHKSLLSKSEDLDLVNKFNIVFTMAKECISQASFHNMCSADDIASCSNSTRAYPCGIGRGRTFHDLVFYTTPFIFEIVNTVEKLKKKTSSVFT